MEDFSLEGKVAILTGASRGIGRAIALRFAGVAPASDYVTGSVFVVDGGMNVASPMAS